MRPARGSADTPRVRLLLPQGRFLQTKSQSIHTEVATGMQSHVHAPYPTQRCFGGALEGKGQELRKANGRREGTGKVSLLCSDGLGRATPPWSGPRLQALPFPSLVTFFREVSQASIAFPSHSLDRGSSARKPQSCLLSG